MIFNIPEQRLVVILHPPELTKDLLIRFFQNIGQDIQSTAMWHTDNEFLGAQQAALFHDGIQCRDQRFGTFQGGTSSDRGIFSYP